MGGSWASLKAAPMEDCSDGSMVVAREHNSVDETVSASVVHLVARKVRQRVGTKVEASVVAMVDRKALTLVES